MSLGMLCIRDVRTALQSDLAHLMIVNQHTFQENGGGTSGSTLLAMKQQLSSGVAICRSQRAWIARDAAAMQSSLTMLVGEWSEQGRDCAGPRLGHLPAARLYTLLAITTVVTCDLLKIDLDHALVVRGSSKV